jgi:hypothetical protein
MRHERNAAAGFPDSLHTKVNRCLAEGRKSFLERYAGIESGRECERLAPALSAFVDGEADAAKTVELRAHLRQCLSCGAAMRGLHDASRPLEVVFPAAGLLVAGGGAEHTGSFFVRVYERAANSFLRAQAVVDTVTAGKMAAVAASAAAVAGGSFAVEGAMTARDDRPTAVLRGAQGLAAVPIVARQRQQPRTRTRPRRRQRRSPSRACVPTARPARHRQASLPRARRRPPRPAARARWWPRPAGRRAARARRPRASSASKARESRSARRAARSLATGIRPLPASVPRAHGRGTGSSARCDDQTMPESIDILLRWEHHGAVWRARSVTGTEAVVDLCTCTGEPVDQLRSNDPAVLRYLADRPRSDED